MRVRYTEDQIKKLREMEQEILDVVVSFTERNLLRYSLGYGTLIGALRHKGFIPWDDDIDIIMPREDYELFREKWLSSQTGEYYLHDYYTDSNCTNNFMKIRKNHTTFLNTDGLDNPNMSGISIDIFPADRVAQSRLGKVIQFSACAINLLYTRQFTSGSGGIVGIGERLLLHVSREKQIKIRNYAEKVKKRWNRIGKGLLMNAATIKESRIYFPEDMFDDLIEVEFNGKYYKATASYDEYLSLMYGDYMKLPPESERVYGHAPQILDFERNYDELREKEK